MTESSKLAGVIGGMGPDATVDFMARVIAFTPAGRDQDHIRMLIDHNPKIPSRHDAVLGDGKTPGSVLAEMASGLEVGGADFLVMPCNMAHIFQNEIAAATSIPLISIIDETAMAIGRDQPDVKTIGLLASEGCIRSGMYQAALEDKGLLPVLQTESELAKLMALINSIKAGKRTENVAIDMQDLAAILIGRGAQVIVAACTEIPLVLNDEMLSVPLISSTDVLAQKTVALARCDIELPE